MVLGGVLEKRYSHFANETFSKNRTFERFQIISNCSFPFLLVSTKELDSDAANTTFLARDVNFP